MSIPSGKERTVSVHSARKKSRRTTSDIKTPDLRDDWKQFPVLFQKYCEARLCPMYPKVYNFLERDDGQFIQIDYPLSNMDYKTTENKLVIYTYTNREMNIRKTVCKCPHVIDTRMFFALNQTLLNYSSMTCLKLEFCNIGADHIIILQDSLKTKNIITELSLVGNPIKEQSYYRLIYCGLKSLILRFCEITDRGLKKIAREFLNHDSDFATLIHLDLSSNMIFDEGCKYIATILKCDRTLQSISLIDCKITDVGCATLISCFNKFALNFEEVYKRRTIRLEYLKQLQKVNVDKDEPEFILLENKINRYPFTNHESFAAEGEIFCMGNYTLISLNISHNNLTSSSLDLVLKSLVEQTETFGNGKGLRRVILEGQNTPECEDIKSKISDFLSSKNRKSQTTSSAEGSMRSRSSAEAHSSAHSAGFDKEEKVSFQ
ncbi:unnamed protein product [Ceutorhynchus assimilis]|uniref:Uncharacterized protein n=1 Tax=Ceutorhynchus assimilis TaxID=467358 RepID=A0A9N9QGU7_9CUCU|nr:unnamed protein product [Ceutorhynchus assimilis]